MVGDRTMDICQVLFFIAFISFFIMVFFFVYLSKRQAKAEMMKRAQDLEPTRAILSAGPKLSDLRKRKPSAGKDMPVKLTPYDSLVGRYKGRLTYVRLFISDERLPSALDLYMVHRAKILFEDNLNLIVVSKGLSGEKDIRNAEGLIGRFDKDLWSAKAEFGDVEEALLNDVVLWVRVKYVRSEKDLARVLDAMAEICTVSETIHGQLTETDYPAVDEFDTVGKGKLRLEPSRIVYTDPLKRTNVYQYDEIIAMMLEQFEDADSINYPMQITFNDDVHVVLDMKYDTAQSRQGIRARILGQLGLLGPGKGAVGAPVSQPTVNDGSLIAPDQRP